MVDGYFMPSERLFVLVQTITLLSNNRRSEEENTARNLILAYYRKPLKGEQIKYLNTAQIMLRFGGAIRLGNNQLVRVLKELGFTQARTSSCRFWLMVERTQEEMAQMLPEPIEEIETAATDPSEAADTLQDKETIQDKETFPDKDLYVDGGGDRTLPSEPELW